MTELPLGGSKETSHKVTLRSCLYKDATETANNENGSNKVTSIDIFKQKLESNEEFRTYTPITYSQLPGESMLIWMLQSLVNKTLEYHLSALNINTPRRHSNSDFLIKYLR